ncbi:uncharacterized protein LOC127847782 [Dreissena polymorpha]|uniref:MRN complex-interacting protein N-terminal domain-containing protein n=1 Tax=Dreissena polymorpha TaxID=45954 RepID=A0A9D4DGA2_DREPO|nr:uncharacterized protein LOC127847782 [Dreissena polymorpha]KAH3748754.1 hypothetical protein DPMN_183204 [Dreissena polymorpha]
MPQEFQVLKCFNCNTFQVHQVKKALKWACKMCGEKQSIKKVYGGGTGAECRHHVQKLNTMRGEMTESSWQHEAQNGSLPWQPENGDYETTAMTSTLDIGPSSDSLDTSTSQSKKWVQFLESTNGDEEADDRTDENDDCLGYYDTRPFVKKGHKRQRKMLDPSLKTSKPTHNQMLRRPDSSTEPLNNNWTNLGTSDSRMNHLTVSLNHDLTTNNQDFHETTPVNMLPSNKRQNNPVTSTSKWSKFSFYNNIENACEERRLEKERSGYGNRSSDSLLPVEKGFANNYKSEFSNSAGNDEKSGTLSQSSSTGSYCGSITGECFINHQAPFPDPRPYTSFDDLQPCNGDFESCIPSAGGPNHPANGPVIISRKVNPVFCGNSKWNMFTGSSTSTTTLPKQVSNSRLSTFVREPSLDVLPAEATVTCLNTELEPNKVRESVEGANNIVSHMSNTTQSSKEPKVSQTDITSKGGAARKLSSQKKSSKDENKGHCKNNEHQKIFSIGEINDDDFKL